MNASEGNHMNASEIAAYRAESARMATVEEAKAVHDAELIASRDKAVIAALRVLRDADHENALAEDKLIDAWTPTRQLGHPAEPHSRRPSECRVCHRPIHNRYDREGNLVSSAHLA